MVLCHHTWAMGMAPMRVGCFGEKCNNCAQNCKIELIMRLLRQKGNFAAQIEWSSYSRQGDGYRYCLQASSTVKEKWALRAKNVR